MSAGAVTLEDVANKVGVSPRTVSRVVNDEGGCSPATRERILAAIEELGYRPNLMARGLIRRTSDTIGVLTASMLDPFFPEVAEGVNRAARELGLTMLLASTQDDAAEQARALRSFQGHGVEGAIVFPARGGDEDLVRFGRTGLPIVVVNSDQHIGQMTTVSADIRRGAELAIEHLVARGRGRIALVIEEKANNDEPIARRKAGYFAALEAAGLAPDDDLVVPVDNSIRGGRDGVDQLLDNGVAFDGVFAYNDVIALGALGELAERGLHVPDDVAVVGFDDIAFCESSTPRLTSVRIHGDEIGRLAVAALRDFRESGEPAAHSVPVSLVVRDSS